MYFKYVNIEFLISILCHHMVYFLLASRLRNEMWQKSVQFEYIDTISFFSDNS